jgi:hypothetical protein
MIPHFTIQEAKVFSNPETYEIELEVDNRRVGTGSKFDTLEKLMTAIRNCIRIVLTGLQESKFPISYTERDSVLSAYMDLLHPDQEGEGGEGEEEKKMNPSAEVKEKKRKRILPRDFIGPGSYTLQMENIVELDESSNVPNIRKNYCVTDKADGDRKLLYISGEGKVYMIDTNMKVSFTGSKTSVKSLYHSLLDGEHVKYDKDGKFINLYLAFDLYYANNKSVREFEFDSTEEDEEEDEEKKEEKEEKKYYRLPLLNHLIQKIKLTSILATKKEVEAEQDKTPGLRLECKTFYKSSPTQTLFQGCSTILGMTRDRLFEYNTDGLIFTPVDLPAGGTSKRAAGPLYKSTWDRSFKWKPPQYNTIDFLVTLKQDKKTGTPEMHHVFQEGNNLQSVQEVKQYRVLILRCGFDNKKHGYLNPFQDLVNGKIPSPTDIDNEGSYHPVPFLPTNPSDDTACYANIWLTDGKHMITEEGEYFDENMIVEFQYVKTNAVGWRWVPLRVRYDKTSELLAGGRNYGNAYHVANNNWQSIHDPITEEMISTGQLNERQQADITDKYYNRGSSVNNTQSLRDFHNLFVKRSIITAASNKNDTLIDYAVGKAGDMSKWMAAKLGFVFGIDISKDNIHNQIDGACARYLNMRKKTVKMFDALFIVGTSANNIRDGSAFATEKDKQISNAVFGQGAKDQTTLGLGVYSQYGKGEQGFNVSSCQFALHYFFENKTTLHSFLRNIAECTKINGYFVGTCYDGGKVFQLLSNKKRDESVTIFKNEAKIYEVTKLYDQTGFPDDEQSIGYPINVYQESINLIFREYLVNFPYLVQLMEDYGFVLVTKEEAKHLNIPNGSGYFSELFTYMENELKKNPRMKFEYGTALSMSQEEKRISFMNRYFIFRKVRSVDAKKIGEVLLKKGRLPQTEEEEGKEEKKEEETAPSLLVKKPKETKPKASASAGNKRQGKVTLKKYEPIEEVKGDSETPVLSNVPKKKLVIKEDTETTAPAAAPKKKLVIKKDTETTAPAEPSTEKKTPAKNTALIEALKKAKEDDEDNA